MALSVTKNLLTKSRKWLRNNKPGRRYVETAYGVRMRANWDDWTFKFCIQGEFGFEYQRYLQDIQTEFVYIDIGANQGLYSLVAAKNQHCRECLAFEPVRQTHRLLVANAKANKLMHIIRPFKLAIAQSSQSMSISIPEEHSGLATLRADKKIHWSKDRSETIRAINGAVIESLTLNGHLPVHIKVDVEGYEEEVFHALKMSSLLDRAQSIFYEVNEEWTNNQALEKILCSRGIGKMTRIGEGRQYDILAVREE